MLHICLENRAHLILDTSSVCVQTIEKRGDQATKIVGKTSCVNQLLDLAWDGVGGGGIEYVDVVQRLYKVLCVHLSVIVSIHQITTS